MTNDQHSLLMEQYHASEADLLRFLSKRIGSASIAEEVVQDLYLKIRQAQSLPAIQDARSFLFTMAANLATDRLRKDNRRSAIISEAEGVLSTDRTDVTPERAAMATFEVRFLSKEFAKLPLRTQQIFHLSRFEGKTQAEIAKQLGIGLSTVARDFHRALSVLMEARQKFRNGETGHDE